MIKLFENYNKEKEIKYGLDDLIKKLKVFFNQIKRNEDVVSSHERFLLKIMDKGYIYKRFYFMSRESHFGGWDFQFGESERGEGDEVYIMLEKYLNDKFSTFFKKKKDKTKFSYTSFHVDNIRRKLVKKIDFSVEEYEVFKDSERFGLW